MDDTRYKTFWRRFGAGIIDSFVLAPVMLFAIPLIVVAIANGSEVLLLAVVAMMSSASILYSVLMHSNGGQTVGKMATGVVVVREADLGPIGMAEAIKRDSGQIFFAVTGWVILALTMPDLDGFGQTSGNENPIGAVNDWASGLWFLAEMVSIWTNPRRRAVHDFIAGTVVVKKAALDADRGAPGPRSVDYVTGIPQSPHYAESTPPAPEGPPPPPVPPRPTFEP
jgi:uncharacterized RDD family membrane protein YckC